jgi:hypothetical protein
MEVVRGRIEDGPWSLVLAELGRNGLAGQLTIRAAGKVHALAFAHGSIVGATSPMAVDSVARIAAGMQLPVLPMRDRGLARGHVDRELETFVKATKLTPDLVKKLERRILIQRAARTFAIERGTYEISSRISIPVMLGVDVDVRAVVLAGALHLDTARIVAGFSGGGARYSLGDAPLEAFEFEDADRPIVDALRIGTSAPELEAKHRELDPKRVQAVFYALATCGALVKELPKIARGSVEMERLGGIPMLIRKDQSEPVFDARPTTLRPNVLGASDLVTLISTRSLTADHFALLGVPVGASVEQVRAAFVELSRNLRNERLVELRIKDPEYRARSLLARACIAYTVLTDPARRAEYIAGMKPIVAELDFARLAREAFDRGRRALRADTPDIAVIELRTACELAPNEIGYIATLGHAEFCARHSDG